MRPGAKNVVPGECTFSLDVRAPTQAALEDVLRRFRAEARAIGDRRGVTSTVDTLANIPVSPLDLKMRDLFRRAARAVGVDAPEMVSGAGHDAQNPALSGVPTGMLFVRSTGGSHTPREDCALDCAVLVASALALAIKELAG